MAESRAERLARIRRYVESTEVHTRELSAWDKDGDAVTVGLGDVEWLLEQVSGDVEYRVEVREWKQRGWAPLSGPYRSMCAADVALEQELAIAEDTDFTGEYRITSAPVQMWTPIEEGA